MTKTAFFAATALALSFSNSFATVTIVHEYNLGEAGSLSGNLPLDSVGSLNFTDSFGTIATGTSGVFAPGSTAYTSLPSAGFGTYNAAYSPTDVVNDDFAFGIFARQSTQANGTAFMTSGGANALKLAMGSNGWSSSVDNVAWVGEANGVTGSFTADEWVHLALISEDGIVTFYLDGVSQGTFDNTADTIIFGDLHLYTDTGGGEQYAGDLDEFRIATFTGGIDSHQNVINALQGVPEPSSYALLAGLLGLGYAMVRRRR